MQSFKILALLKIYIYTCQYLEFALQCSNMLQDYRAKGHDEEAQKFSTVRRKVYLNILQGLYKHRHKLENYLKSNKFESESVS